MNLQSPSGGRRARPVLSRAESQARTRERLLDSAARLFARRGIASTTIAAIVANAGHTRGAFYAHFDSKDELSLEILEQRFSLYLERFESVLDSDEAPEERARRAGEQLTAMFESDPVWRRLWFEFAAYAVHNDRFRRKLIRRYADLRAGVERIFRLRAAEAGIEPPISLERLTLMTFLISMGLSLTILLEPDRFGEELHAELLEIFFAGLRRIGEEQ